MTALVECVPNFSEGKNSSTIEAILNEITSVEGVTLLDSDPGSATNRTVVTFVGEPEPVKEAAFNAISKAKELIDMSQHKGEHPRMGATDVCPFVPVSGISMDECVKLSKELAERVGTELGIPIYLYENSALTKDRKNLADVRIGEYEALKEKLTKTEWKPDFGPDSWNESINGSGATVIGAREFLIAYNVNLNTRNKKLASDIALTIREKGRKMRDSKGKFVRDSQGKPKNKPGLLKNVRAVGWFIDEYEMAQISINLVNFKKTSLHKVYETCKNVAWDLGVEVTGSELVGLIPKQAMLDAGRYYLRKQMISSGVPEEELVRIAVQSMGLSELSDFKPKDKIIEYRIKQDNPLASMNISDFINEVSMDSPAPGGGSVAALSGALGGALATMVGNLSVNKRKLGIPHYPKKKYGQKLDKMYEACEKGQELTLELVKGIDTDTKAFNGVISAMQMPKGTEKEKRTRNQAIQDGYKEAAEVPLKTAEDCLKIFELSRLMVKEGQKASITDAGVSALMAYSGLIGALMNVRINLGSIKDKEYRDELQGKLMQFQEKGKKELDEILKITNEEIEKKLN